jgi:hypothetical protein
MPPVPITPHRTVSTAGQSTVGAVAGDQGTRQRPGSEMMRVFRGPWTPAHRHLRERLVFVWTVTVVLDLIASLVAWALETGATGSQIDGYGDALFWTTTQLLTISSSLNNPVTTGGKVLDVVLQFLAMTLISSQVGTFGSFLYRRSVERDPITKVPREPDAAA